MGCPPDVIEFVGTSYGDRSSNGHRSKKAIEHTHTHTHLRGGEKRGRECENTVDSVVAKIKINWGAFNPFNGPEM